MPTPLSKILTPKSFMLVSIVIIGFVIRTYQLVENPPGFFSDEAQIGYVNPMYIPAFDFFRPAIPVWFTMITVGLFGLTEFGTRFASVLVGTLSIPATYVLTQSFAKQHTPALLATLLVAISPWHIHMSRVGFEGIYLTFMVTVGLALLLRAHYKAGAAVLGLSIYAYHPGVLQSSGLFLGTMILVLNNVTMKKKAAGFVVFGLMLIPLLHGLATGITSSRMKQISVFSQDSSITEALVHASRNYIGHFDDTFLFLEGDVGYTGQFITRHSVRGMGQLYIWQAPFLIIGLLGLIVRVGRKRSISRIRRLLYSNAPVRTALLILLGWLFLYPFGSAISKSAGPQATRSIIGVVPLQILSAFGVWYLYLDLTKLAKKLCTHIQAVILVQSIYIVGITAMIFVTLVPYLYTFFYIYPTYSADFWGWQYGARDIIGYFKEHHMQYEELYMQPEFNAPHVFFQFYDPLTKCTNCQVGWYHEKYNPDLHQLFAVTPKQYRMYAHTNARIIDSVFYPNGAVAFYLVETTPSQEFQQLYP
jgi:hypothetical protein